MPLYQSFECQAFRPGQVAYEAGALLAVRGIVVPRAALVINDILEAVPLPAGHVPVDAWIDTDDIDSATTATFDAGIMPGPVGSTDVTRFPGTEFFAASTIGQAGGLARTTRLQAMRVIATNVDRSMGIRVLAAPTGVASLGSNNVDRGVWSPGTIYAANDFITLPDGRRARCSTGGTSGANFPAGLGIALFNTTVTDGGVTWTIQDAAIALTVLMRPARNGL